MELWGRAGWCLIKPCISFFLYFVFAKWERGGCGRTFVISMCLTFSPGMRTSSLHGLLVVLSALSFPLVNGWFDRNRWFIRALSCEWGCTVPSTNDRGSQAPSFCPSGAKNWPVWWVPVDYFTFFDLHHSWTSSLRYNLVSLNISPLAHLTSLFLSALSPCCLLSFYFFPLCITSWYLCLQLFPALVSFSWII